MVAAPGAAQPGLASAALRWPRARSRRIPAPRPPPRGARRLRGRRREPGWSRDCWRCTAANKPAPAGLGEIKTQTNKLAQRPGSWGGAWAAGPRVLVPARRGRAGGRAAVSKPRPPAPRRGNRGAGPEDLEGCWQLRCAPRGRSCFPRTAGSWAGVGGRLKVEGLPAPGLSPAAPTSCTAEQAGKFWLWGWEPPFGCPSWGWAVVSSPLT